jgi:hypothetical protein
VFKFFFFSRKSKKQTSNRPCAPPFLPKSNFMAENFANCRLEAKKGRNRGGFAEIGEKIRRLASEFDAAPDEYRKIKKCIATTGRFSPSFSLFAFSFVFPFQSRRPPIRPGGTESKPFHFFDLNSTGSSVRYRPPARPGEIW